MPHGLRLVAFAVPFFLFATATGARAQSTSAALGDPKKCVVVVEDMGDVGFRISDSQVVAEAIVQQLRKRIGYDAVTYEGLAKSAASMKRMLAAPEATQPQEAQLAWFKQCMDAAPYRVKAKFGTSKGKNWISVACRKKDADPKEPLEEKRFEGKTFQDARDQLAATLPTFCTQMAPASSSSSSSSSSKSSATGNAKGVVGVGDIPNEAAVDAGVPGLRKPEAPKPWTPPPRRD